MAGLIQCPNCLSMVDSADAFCMLCGHSLAGVAAAAEAAPAVEPAFVPAEEPVFDPAAEPAPKVVLKKEEAPALYCPNGHAVTNPGLGFCDICGALLVTEVPAAPAEEPAPAVPDVPAVRFVSSKCRICGTTIYDDTLEYCPNCGNLLTPGSLVPLPTWTCRSCGAENDESNAFCLNCGQPRTAAAPHAAEPKKHAPPPPRPAGMKPPTDDDLMVKSRGGNWT